MSAIIAIAAANAQPAVPSIAALMSSLPGSYQSIEEAPPAKAAAYTSTFVIAGA